MVEFKPLHDYILVERVSGNEHTTEAGLILPLDVDPGTIVARVVGVGPGLYMENGTRLVPEVEEGDLVMIASDMGYSISLGDKAYRALRYDDVIGVLQAEIRDED